MFDQIIQPLFHGQGVEKMLALLRVGKESLRDHIADRAGVLDATEMLPELLRHWLAIPAEPAGEVNHFESAVRRARGINYPGGLGNHRGDAKWGSLLPSQNFDPLQTRQHEMGRSVPVGDAGSNQAHGRHGIHRIGILIRVDSGTAVADAEHPVALQRELQHTAVTLLEDKERHVAMREERGAAQNHHGNGVGNLG